MRVHIKNIVASAISRGLIDGFDTVRGDLQHKKLTEEAEIAALGKIGLAIWQELDDVIDFSDEDDEMSAGKSSKTPMGFAASTPEPVIVDAVSNQALPNDEELDDDDDDGTEPDEDEGDAIDTWSRTRSARYRMQLETLLRSRPRRS